MTNIFFRNTEFLKREGPIYLTKLGFINIGFEGLDANLIFGGFAWFQAMKENSPFIYTIQLRKQDDNCKWIFERILNEEAALTNKVTK